MYVSIYLCVLTYLHISKSKFDLILMLNFIAISETFLYMSPTHQNIFSIHRSSISTSIQPGTYAVPETMCRCSDLILSHRISLHNTVLRLGGSIGVSTQYYSSIGHVFLVCKKR